MVKKLLADLEFSTLIGESVAQTATGASLLDKYKAYVMANESSCKLVNSFIAEASKCQYDNGVYNVLDKISDYIQCNKTSWALESVCESLRNDNTSRNYLNKSAVSQVEKLLENDEETINRYIKAGALKNVMYVTEFRNIAKQVYHDTPMIESTVDYTVVRPISFVEYCGDGYMFEAAGKVFSINGDKTITEASWNDVSNTFRVISSLLESNMCRFDESKDSLVIEFNNSVYTISEAGKCKKCKKNDKKEEEEEEMTCEQLRDNNRLVLMVTNPRQANNVASVLEAIALTCENYDHIAKMDNTGIYSTKSDRFLVVNENTNMFATLLQSNHSGAWTFNCNVIEALENIKAKTRVNISEKYTEQVKNTIEEASAADRDRIEKELQESKKNDIKARIQALTEKFKDDPTKLAILSQVAQDLQTVED